jgi:hypothetical protein
MSATGPGIRVESGTPVTIGKGALAGISGEVAEMWSGEGAVRATLTIFGRPVTVELDPWVLRPSVLPREDTWPEGTSLERMLASAWGHGTDRQLRLFAVACCRRISHLMTEDRCKRLVAERGAFVALLEDWRALPPNFLMQTVEIVEQMAEGDDLIEELSEAGNNAFLLWRVRDNYYGSHDESDGPIDWELLTMCAAARAVYEASQAYIDKLDPHTAAASAAHATYRAAGGTEEDEDRLDAAETAAQCDLVRDIFGCPLRLTVADTGWLTPTVMRLARGIYDNRSFEEMPILGDALEDAGCADEAVLSHARGSLPHARGCWLLDLLLRG